MTGRARRPPVPRPLSITSCSYERLVTKLGDPFAGRQPLEVQRVDQLPPVPGRHAHPDAPTDTFPAVTEEDLR